MFGDAEADPDHCTYLEIATIEHAVRVDDDQTKAPFENVVVYKLKNLGSVTRPGAGAVCRQSQGLARGILTLMLTHFSLARVCSSDMRRCLAPPTGPCREDILVYLPGYGRRNRSCRFETCVAECDRGELLNSEGRTKRALGEQIAIVAE